MYEQYLGPSEPIFAKEPNPARDPAREKRVSLKDVYVGRKRVEKKKDLFSTPVNSGTYWIVRKRTTGEFVRKEEDDDLGNPMPPPRGKNWKDKRLNSPPESDDDDGEYLPEEEKQEEERWRNAQRAKAWKKGLAKQYDLDRMKMEVVEDGYEREYKRTMRKIAQSKTAMGKARVLDHLCENKGLDYLSDNDSIFEETEDESVNCSIFDDMKEKDEETAVPRARKRAKPVVASRSPREPKTNGKQVDMYRIQVITCCIQVQPCK